MIDIHAHFYTARSGRPDWKALNRRRLEVGDRIGIAVHVASILGTWGRESPTYFPSPDDVRHANDAMLEMAADSGGRIRAWCVVNPNHPARAVEEIERAAEGGAVGLKLAASRRCTDPLLDPVIEAAHQREWPVLHHVWQRRRREWPGQEASDAVELGILARRHPRVRFILAHIAGGGDWSHSLRAVADLGNVYVDLSGSGADAGMVDAVLETVGADRLVWGCDVTMGTGLARVRELEVRLNRDDVERITSGNARALFPAGAFG